MAARFSSNSVFDSLPPNSRAKPFLRQAMRAFNDREELVSIEALQGCMLLQFCAFVECDANQDALLSCQAIRMAQLLRLLMMQNIDRIAQEVEINVYWQVWMLDCWNSVRAEIPRQLTDRTGFPKPLQEDLFYSIPAAESTQDWAFESTRELSVWGKIIPLTEYHAQTVKLNYDIVHDPAFNFRNIGLVRDISSKLDSWLRKLPPTLHNTAENLAAYTNRGFGRTFAEMHLTYHHTSQLLYYQFLNRYVDRNDASSAIIDEEAQTYVELCRSHAAALSKLMWSLHSSSDLDCLWTPVNGHLLVIASTVHLHTMLLGSSSPEINMAKKLLEQNFLILQELERYWPLINIAFSRLHAFHHACQTRDASKAFNMDHWMGIFLNQFDIPMDNRVTEANFSKDLNMYLPAQSISPESPTGFAFIEQALGAGHRLTIYARNPSKLAKETQEHPSVRTVKGELGDVDKLTEAAACGATVFVSFAGPTKGHVGKPVSTSYEILVPLLIKNNFQRAFIVCTVSWISPEDKFSLTWSLIRLLIKTMARDAFEDLVAIGNYVSSIPTDQLAWTIMRLPNLSDGQMKPVKEAVRGDGNDGMSLTRSSLAQWVLKEIDEKKWVGKSPMISN
ncbi:C6 transcription factor [Fusarium pseudocircinatum]|uniref:C6 transcription factor n=1 Tax=Fusarium pseudocircinatum TaxID=56676 RepID=A0A8H5NPB2_9HYPO|nr:C6 transcription factor [Fusarium pseudocircinatum]